MSRIDGSEKSRGFPDASQQNIDWTLVWQGTQFVLQIADVSACLACMTVGCAAGRGFHGWKITMKKSSKLFSVRIGSLLDKAIETELATAGDKTRSATVRRLIELGLDNPYFTAEDVELLDGMVRELRQHNEGLSKFVRPLGNQDALQSAEIEAVLAQAIGRTNAKVRAFLA